MKHSKESYFVSVVADWHLGSGVGDVVAGKCVSDPGNGRGLIACCGNVLGMFPPMRPCVWPNNPGFACIVDVFLYKNVVLVVCIE